MRFVEKDVAVSGEAPKPVLRAAEQCSLSGALPSWAVPVLGSVPGCQELREGTASCCALAEQSPDVGSAIFLHTAICESHLQ